jgi:hypothetical protein
MNTIESTTSGTDVEVSHLRRRTSLSGMPASLVGIRMTRIGFGKE